MWRFQTITFLGVKCSFSQLRLEVGATVTIAPSVPIILCAPLTCTALVVEQEGRIRQMAEILFFLLSRREKGEKVPERQKNNAETKTRPHLRHFFTVQLLFNETLTTEVIIFLSLFFWNITIKIIITQCTCYRDITSYCETLMWLHLPSLLTFLSLWMCFSSLLCHFWVSYRLIFYLFEIFLWLQLFCHASPLCGRLSSVWSFYVSLWPLSCLQTCLYLFSSHLLRLLLIEFTVTSINHHLLAALWSYKYF